MRERGPIKRRWLLVGGVIGAAAMAACSDASRMFTGIWKSEAALASDWISGRPELAIGHFGPELTGIVRFLDDEGLPTLTCRCAFIDQQDVDLDTRHFVATTTLCDGETLWIWELELNDGGQDPRLVGEVRRAADESEPPVGVSFVLDDEFVPDDLRECPQ